MPPSSKNTRIKIIAGIIVLVLAGLGIWQLNKNQTTTEQLPTSEEQPATTTTPEENPPATINRKYGNGTYSATGKYSSPAGGEEVFITLVIKDDIVTSATFEGRATNSTSKMLQGLFAEGFKELVVGKSVDSISLTVVNGSSLTPKGFMDALAKIKIQANA